MHKIVHYVFIVVILSIMQVSMGKIFFAGLKLVAARKKSEKFPLGRRKSDLILCAKTWSKTRLFRLRLRDLLYQLERQRYFLIKYLNAIPRR